MWMRSHRLNRQVEGGILAIYYGGLCLANVYDQRKGASAESTTYVWICQFTLVGATTPRAGLLSRTPLRDHFGVTII